MNNEQIVVWVLLGLDFVALLVVGFCGLVDLFASIVVG